MNEELPESTPESQENPASDYYEKAQRIKNRSPEEKRVRLLEVARGAGLLSMENLAAAGFYSKEEINKLTWKMLNDRNLTAEQRERVKALRKKGK